MIRGWANYHKGSVAKETFAKVDTEVWKALWQWAIRRHPTKGLRWIKERYFKTEGNRNWIFSESTMNEDGETRTMELVKASDTKIERYTKIKGESNPFDPAQETYFESRLGQKMQGNLKGRMRLQRLYLSGRR